MIPTRHQYEDHLTIDEILLELEIMKEKHGGSCETNITELRWISPKHMESQAFVCLINPKYEETALR